MSHSTEILFRVLMSDLYIYSNFALFFFLTPPQLVLSPTLSVPTLISVLWGWEYGVDGCINNAVLPGNQTRCSGVLCRILKRYLFVRGCHPPPPVRLRSPLISISILPRNCLNDHPASMYSSVCLCFKDVHCTYYERVHQYPSS